MVKSSNQSNFLIIYKIYLFVCIPKNVISNSDTECLSTINSLEYKRTSNKKFKTTVGYLSKYPIINSNTFRK